jgi:hypothetical protein
MRGFGGPSGKRSRSSSLSIYETIVMHRKLGTFAKKNIGTETSILSTAWNVNKKLAEKDEQSKPGNIHRLDDPNDKGPFTG